MLVLHRAAKVRKAHKVGEHVAEDGPHDAACHHRDIYMRANIRTSRPVRTNAKAEKQPNKLVYANCIAEEGEGLSVEMCTTTDRLVLGRHR